MEEVLPFPSLLDCSSILISFYNSQIFIITEEDFENPKGALNKLYTKGIIDEPVYEIVDQIYDDDDNRQLWACSCTVDGYETQQCEGYYYKMKHAEADAAKKVLMEILKDNPGL